MNKQALKTFLILKHGNLDCMYWDWLVGDIKELSDEERAVLADHRDITREELNSIYSAQTITTG